jgi:hypothetical protein
MTTEELAELFLCHLYDLAEAAPHPNFLFSVNDFAPRYGVTDLQELQRAITCLGDRGLVILAGLDIFGGISAGITMEGCVFVEKGGETGVIARYRKSPGQFIVESPAPLQATSTRTDTLSPPIVPKETPFTCERSITALLLDVEETLKNDGGIAPDIKEDALADFAALRAQLSRKTRNPEIIKALLSGLPKAASVSPLIEALACLVNPCLE